MKILLASQSPRRKELLKELGYDFEVVSIVCNEIFPKTLEIEKIAAFLSELKANCFRDLQQDEVLITADTIVVLGNEVLGKPKDKKEATEMLKKLSAKTHRVFTGLTIKNREKTITKTDIASIEFDHITHSEIEFYLEKHNPYDKAGSYGIQEWLGMVKIKKIEGSFYTIMGFPTHLVYQILKDFE